MKRLNALVPPEIGNTYPNAVVHQLEDGTLIYTAEIAVGGTDDEGTFFFVLDGPAEGEKAYV